jgi:hypothetical protein
MLVAVQLYSPMFELCRYWTDTIHRSVEKVGVHPNDCIIRVDNNGGLRKGYPNPNQTFKLCLSRLMVGRGKYYLNPNQNF